MRQWGKHQVIILISCLMWGEFLVEKNVYTSYKTANQMTPLGTVLNPVWQVLLAVKQVHIYSSYCYKTLWPGRSNSVALVNHYDCCSHFRQPLVLHLNRYSCSAYHGSIPLTMVKTWNEATWVGQLHCSCWC